MTSVKTKTIDDMLKAREFAEKMAREALVDPVKFVEFVMQPQKRDSPRIIAGDGHYELVERMQSKRRHLVIIASPMLGKTTFATYGMSLWRLGHNPDYYRALVGAAKMPSSTKHLVAIRDYIERNKRLRMVFPKMVPGTPWTQDSFTIQRSPNAFVTQPSYEACGDMGEVQGFRQQDHWYEDMVTPSNSISAYLMEKLCEWVMDNESRCEPDGGQRFFIQNSFRRSDTGRMLVEKHGWDLFMMPAVNEKGKTLYSHIYPQKVCDEYAPSRREQDLECKTKKEGDQEFADAYIDVAKSLGVGLTTVRRLDHRALPAGVFTVCGVDLAFRKNRKSDNTCFFTCLVGPPSYWLEILKYLPEAARDILRTLDTMSKASNRVAKVMRVLSVESRKMLGPDHVAAVIDHWERYGCWFEIESNAAQDTLRQNLQVSHPEIPIVPYHTSGPNKSDEDTGIRGLQNELLSGHWIYPCQETSPGSGIFVCEPEIAQLIRDLQAYDKTTHTADTIMAKWFARIRAREYNHFEHRLGLVNMGANSGAQAPNPIAGVMGNLAERAAKVGVVFRPDDAAEKARDEIKRSRL